MVEFGLKLEDNKVSEWAAFYLNYDALKAILKKAKGAIKNYEEAAKKRPEDAKAILQAHRAGNFSSITSKSPMPSALSLDALESDEAPPTERTSLIKIPSVPGISEFFGSRYERALRGYLKEADEKGQQFEETLLAEQKKAVDFYYDKLGELENQLQFLIESVNDSPYIQAKLEKIEKEGGRHGSHTRTPSNNIPSLHIADLIAKFSKSSNKETELVKRQKSGIGVVRIDDVSDDEKDAEEKGKALAEADSIKRALIDQYRTAKLLHNFTILNYTGMVKIVKKHDKTLPSRKGKLKGALEPQNLFNEGKAVESLANKYEKYFANWFCDGDIRAANAQMLPKRGDGLEMDWSQLRLGYRMGMCAVLALWVCWDSVWGLVVDGNSTIGGRSAFPVFRACGGILSLQWFWGCSVFIWTRYRVNYIYLFDFNPRVVATPVGVFEEAVDNTLVFMLLMLLYYKAGAHDIPEIIPTGSYPFILVLYTATQLIFPLRTRIPMWEAIWKVVTAPMHPPSFFHGYIGDIFTSMVKVFQDIAWTICWVVSGEFTRSEELVKDGVSFGWPSSHWYKNFLIPIICLFPLVVRCNQCLRRYLDTGDRFPHLANATKYALSQTVTLFGAFHPLYLEYGLHAGEGFNLFQIFWVIVFVSSSLFSFTWDVYMDWGLGRPEYGFLGQCLMYPKRYYYYIVIALDLVLRFMWVLTLVPPSSGARFEVPNYLSALTMLLELFRRTIWGFLRLENEHRSNAAGFRRVGFVPLHFNTGHHHRYADKKKESSGQTVLREVVLVALLVVGVCVSSVVAAQKANRFTAKAMMQEL